MNIEIIGYGVSMFCNKCKTDKPLECFSERKDNRLGFRTTCRECDNVSHRKYERNRYASSEKFRLEYNKKKSEWKKEHKYNYSQPQTEQRRCYDRVKYAIKSGKIVKPKQCELCGSDKFLHAHHEDYSKPLEIVWMCSRCHRYRHRKM